MTSVRPTEWLDLKILNIVRGKHSGRLASSGRPAERLNTEVGCWSLPSVSLVHVQDLDLEQQQKTAAQCMASECHPSCDK